MLPRVRICIKTACGLQNKTITVEESVGSLSTVNIGVGLDCDNMHVDKQKVLNFDSVLPQLEICPVCILTLSIMQPQKKKLTALLIMLRFIKTTFP